MACKLYLNKALKRKSKSKPTDSGSGGLSGWEALLRASDRVIIEGFREEGAFELGPQEKGDWTPEVRGGRTLSRGPGEGLVDIHILLLSDSVTSANGLRLSPNLPHL